MVEVHGLCGKCEQEFDNAKRAPRVARCGHSLCEDCLNAALNERNWHAFRCPECKSTMTPANGERFELAEFPKNFGLLKLIAGSVEASEKRSMADNLLAMSRVIEEEVVKCAAHPNEAAGFLCLETRCLGKPAFCYLCIAGKSATCSPSFLIPKNQLVERVDLPSLSFTDLKLEEVVFTEVARKVDALKLSLLNKAMEELKPLFDSVRERKSIGLGEVSKKCDKLCSTLDGKSGKITIRQRVDVPLEKGFEKVNEKLNDFLATLVANAEKDLLKKIGQEVTATFLKEKEAAEKMEALKPPKPEDKWTILLRDLNKTGK